MSSALFEARLYTSARAFLHDEATEQERQEVGRIIDQLLCYDPWIDNRTKIAFPMPPAILTLYANNDFWILYHIANNTTIRIWNIGRATDRPMPYRRRAGDVD